MEAIIVIVVVVVVLVVMFTIGSYVEDKKFEKQPEISDVEFFKWKYENDLKRLKLSQNDVEKNQILVRQSLNALNRAIEKEKNN